MGVFETNACARMHAHTHSNSNTHTHTHTHTHTNNKHMDRGYYLKKMQMYLGTYPCEHILGVDPKSSRGVRYFFNFGVKCINLVHFEGKIKRLDLWKHPYETDATSCRQTVPLCEANPHLRSVAFTIAYIKNREPPGPPDGQSGPVSSPLLATNLNMKS